MFINDFKLYLYVSNDLLRNYSFLKGDIKDEGFINKITIDNNIDKKLATIKLETIKTIEDILK